MFRLHTFTYPARYLLGVSSTSSTLRRFHALTCVAPGSLAQALVSEGASGGVCHAVRAVQDDGRVGDDSDESDEADAKSLSLHSDSESEAASGSGDEAGAGEQRLSIRTGTLYCHVLVRFRFCIASRVVSPKLH